MADQEIGGAGAVAEGAEARREWVRPQLQDMMAGAAELGGDTSVDGDPGFS